MPVRKILQVGDPQLREKAQPVSVELFATGELERLIVDLIDTMEHAAGAGLAAPQIGVSLSVAVIRVEENRRYPELGKIPLTVFVNPAVTTLPTARRVHFYEGCLSVPGLRARVTRPAHVRVDALDQRGRSFRREYRDGAASVVQHELDHLEGVLFLDRADPRTFCAISEFERVVPPEARIVVTSEG